MYITILKFLWPRLEKFLADQIAEYLRHRREQQQSQPGAIPKECPPCPPCPPATVAPLETEPAILLNRNIVWFSLSGVLLGSAFGLIAYIFVRDRELVS
jgi:hypothetical protein